MLLNWSSLKESFTRWEHGSEDVPFGFILSMEGADPILSPEHAVDWHEAGLRVVGLAHYGPSVYAHGTGCEGGLTSSGCELLRVMEQLNLILDLTHLADESFWEAIEQFRGPVLASHNNCRAITPGDRQYDDDQIRAIVERDGVIGAALDAWMLAPGWTGNRVKNPTVKLDSVLNHIDHICQLAGNVRHVAIGSDLDGGFGTEQSPEDLDTIADLQELNPLLRKRGYSEADVRAIFHGNWMRFFERTWKS
jgi:membrane dipeptidase